MLTILNAIELSKEYLEKREVESPRINAELLLAHILKCKRMDLYLRFEQPLKDDEVAEYRELIRRRGKREPVQYIIGSVEFYGIDFFVDRNVLIPRQETEHLVEEIINIYKSKNKVNIIDIGTGSGNIAVSLARNLPNAIIQGIDKSSAAIEIAEKNAKKNSAINNLSFKSIDFISFANSNSHKFDVIVSNPPYISVKDYDALELELKKYEPKDALTDHEDGLSFYKIISEKSKNILRENGKLFFEIGFGQSESIRKIMAGSGFINISLIKDYQNIDRVIYGDLS